MANIVKIKDIHLMTGLTAGAADCVRAAELLKAANISYTGLHYNDQHEQHEANFASLSTWPLGKDGSTKKITDYPILTYDVCYEDLDVKRHVDHGLEEIKNGLVLQNPSLTK